MLRSAEPLTPIVTHRLPSEQRRRFEKLRNVPAGFISIGGAVCSFNPIYGQGMSSASLQAVALGRQIAASGLVSPKLPRRFYRSAARIVDGPWQVAVGGDLFHPEATGSRPPMVHTLNRYIRRAVVASHTDPVVASALSQVQNMLALPPSLMRPAVMRRVLRRPAAIDRRPAAPEPVR